MHPLIYLALGSNVGDRQANLRAARHALPPAVDLQACSPIYHTPPWGYDDQPEFLNQALEATTRLPPADLLAYLKSIEHTLGREKTFRYGPRVIDIDILFYGDRVIEEEGLIIPHPRLHERAFVLVPLADLAPEFNHPVLDKTVTELLESVDRQGISRLEPEGATKTSSNPSTDSVAQRPP